MLGKLLAISTVPVLLAALSGGLAFSLGGSAADPAAAEGDGWEAMHEACERGDFQGMLAAMGDMPSEEGHEAMMEHMAEMHSGGWGHMHDGEAQHMHGDDLDDMHSEDHHGMHDGGMMGGMHGSHDH